MITKRQIYILLLALWLPGQSLASALLHCDLVDSVAGSVAEVSAIQETAMPDCHGDTPPFIMSSSETPETLDSRPDITSEHCNGNCHGVQPMSNVPDAEEQAVALNAFIAAPAAAEISNIPENPLRPPKYS